MSCEALLHPRAAHLPTPPPQASQGGSSSTPPADPPTPLAYLGVPRMWSSLIPTLVASPPRPAAAAAPVPEPNPSTNPSGPASEVGGNNAASSKVAGEALSALGKEVPDQKVGLVL